MKDCPCRYSDAIIKEKKLKRELQFMGTYEEKKPHFDHLKVYNLV
jgi:hypothetical protein